MFGKCKCKLFHILVFSQGNCVFSVSLLWVSNNCCTWLMKCSVWIYRHINQRDWSSFCRTMTWMAESIFFYCGAFWLCLNQFCNLSEIQQKCMCGNLCLCCRTWNAFCVSLCVTTCISLCVRTSGFHSPAQWAPGSTPVPLHCSGRGLTACPVWTGPAAAHGAPPSWWSSPLRWNRCSLGPAGKTTNHSQTNGIKTAW